MYFIFLPHYIKYIAIKNIERELTTSIESKDPINDITRPVIRRVYMIIVYPKSLICKKI